MHTKEYSWWYWEFTGFCSMANSSLCLALSHPEREMGRQGLARLLDLLYKGIRAPKKAKARGTP